MIFASLAQRLGQRPDGLLTGVVLQQLEPDLAGAFMLQAILDFPGLLNWLPYWERVTREHPFSLASCVWHSALCHANIRCDTVLAQLRGSSSGMRRVQVEIRSCEVSQKIGTIHWVHVCFQSRFFTEVLIILGFSPCLPSL